MSARIVRTIISQGLLSLEIFVDTQAIDDAEKKAKIDGAKYADVQGGLQAAVTAYLPGWVVNEWYVED